MPELLSGLYNRAILCPPLLSQTYPQCADLESIRDWLADWRYAIVLVFKNDGTKAWEVNKSKLSRIDFKIKKGMELKGTEVASSKAICRLMRKWRTKLKKQGLEVFGLINGHCDQCRGRKCPNRGNPPCRKGGMPALEALGIDCYELLEELNIPYQYPCRDYVTTVTAFLIK